MDIFAHHRVQLTMAMNTIVSKESVIKKVRNSSIGWVFFFFFVMTFVGCFSCAQLEEERNQDEMLLAQNHSTLNALHQKVNSQQMKQKETEEECKRSKSNEVIVTSFKCV